MFNSHNISCVSSLMLCYIFAWFLCWALEVQRTKKEICIRKPTTISQSRVNKLTTPKSSLSSSIRMSRKAQRRFGMDFFVRNLSRFFTSPSVWAAPLLFSQSLSSVCLGSFRVVAFFQTNEPNICAVSRIFSSPRLVSSFHSKFPKKIIISLL